MSEYWNYNIQSRQSIIPRMRAPSAQLSNQQLKKLRKADNLISCHNWVNQQRKNMEAFWLLSSATTDKIVYVDQDKQYGIVQVKYLQQLKDKLKHSEQALAKFSNKIKDEHVTKELFNRIVDAKQKEVDKLQAHINLLENKLAEFERVIRNNEQILDEKQIQFNLLVQKYQAHISTIKNDQTEKFMNKYMRKQHKWDQEVQTSLEIDEPQKNRRMEEESAQHWVDWLESDRRVKKTNEQSLSQIYQQQIKQLKQNMASVLAQMTDKIKEKLQQIQSQKLDIKQWSEANEKLRQQNMQLREEIKITNQQQFKLRTWKSSLENCIQNIENQHKIKQQKFSIFNLPLNPPSNSAQDNPTTNFMAEEKIKLLQVVIDKMQLEQRESKKKLEEIQTIIKESTDTSNVSEENIVGTLLGLSCKIKEVINFLLHEL